MRPLFSSGVETIGWLRGCGLVMLGAPFTAQHLSGLVRYRLGGRGKPVGGDLPEEKPQSPWIDTITDVLERDLKMSHQIRTHSDRTWMFAHAIARDTPDEAPKKKGGRELDDEAIYAACLLHDAGLFDDARSRCFAMVGADLVRATASASDIDPGRAEAVALAVSGHVDVRPRTPFAQLLRSATLVDVIGYLTWKLDPHVLAEASRDHPRTGFASEVQRLWTAEVGRFPYGRAAFAQRPGGLLKLAERNPLDRNPPPS